MIVLGLCSIGLRYSKTSTLKMLYCRCALLGRQDCCGWLGDNSWLWPSQMRGCSGGTTSRTKILGYTVSSSLDSMRVFVFVLFLHVVLGNVHAVHHRLYVPFSYGALYNHWADSIFGDYVAGLLGVYLIRLTAHEQMFFLWLVIFKVVEDHAAYELPWSPSTLLGRLTGCTSTYHHVHHQSWGIKVSSQQSLTPKRRKFLIG